MNRLLVVTVLTALMISLNWSPSVGQGTGGADAAKKDVDALKAAHRENLKDLQEIKSLLGPAPSQEAPSPAEARPPVPQVRRDGPLGPIDDSQRAALVRALKSQPAGTPVWFAVYDQDPAARDLARGLRAAFGEAGWTIRGSGPVAFAIKSGVFLFAADDEPPPYVDTVRQALSAAGMRPTVGTGYRAYYEQMQAKPGWRGFSMTQDQTYVVVIGALSRPAVPMAAAQVAPPASRSRPWTIMLGVAAVLTAVGGGAWYFFIRPRPTIEQAPEPEADQSQASPEPAPEPKA